MDELMMGVGTGVDVLEAHPFWDARASLQHVRQFAYARRVSPWALLGVVIAYRLAELPPNFVLPPLVGSHASLNFYAGLVADSGGGKSAAMGAGRELASSEVFSPEPGSGEALAHLFVSRNKAGEVEWQRRSVLARWDEITTLAGISGRSGATILSKLCTAFVGGEIGSSHVDRQKSLPLGEHEYRFCVLAGVQPSRSNVLLGEKTVGLPQRFLWLPATDVSMPTVKPPDPGALNVADLDPLTDRPGALLTQVVVPVPDAVAAAVDAEQLRRARGGLVDPLDSHAQLVRLKVAVGLDLLDPDVDRPAVTAEGWRLAGLVMDESNRTRTSMTDRLRADRMADAAEAGELEGVRSAARSDTSQAIERVTAWVARKLQDAAMTSGALKRAAPSRDRQILEEVVRSMTSTGRCVMNAAGELELQGPAERTGINWDDI
ncbi:hypothetical protein [Williamsia muralis]|uniref:DUF3987 domain-containing protein n=1 Tax=Williamsia marianensis TaxID=85044 RepID=A0A2G3PHM6_WILMA|nr:hypothetical protein [Williamsia marianensis]PHV64632.1 hypothetical protein CSW57_22805 [Williamsia marianensis]